MKPSSIAISIMPPVANMLSGKIAHHTVEQEEKLLQQILLSKEGFFDLAAKSISRFSNLIAPPLAADPVRSEKNRFIVSATILSRAAIKLGMPTEIAFTHSDHYINNVESLKTLDEVWQYQLALFQFFRDEVHRYRSQDSFHQTTTGLLLYIDSHPDTNSSLQEICSELDMDYKYASTRFSKDTGMGFTKYLTKKKLEIACRKLETSDDSIQDIAEDLGFSSIYYFTRTFKKAYGITPTEHRKQALRH